MFHTLYVLVCREIVVGNEVCPIVKKVGNHSTTLTEKKHSLSVTKHENLKLI